MAADSLKSVSITALDIMTAGTGPIVAQNAGKGAEGVLKEYSDFVTATPGGLVAIASKYKLLRLQWTDKLKSLKVRADTALDTSTGLAVDVGAYYSDSTVDGTPANLQGTSVGGSVIQFANTSTAFQSSVKVSEVLDSGLFTSVMRNQELWQALGLTKNPGGMCDIVLAVHTAATSPGVIGNNISASATFIE